MSTFLCLFSKNCSTYSCFIQKSRRFVSFLVLASGFCVTVHFCTYIQSKPVLNKFSDKHFLEKLSAKRESPFYLENLFWEVIPIKVIAAWLLTKLKLLGYLSAEIFQTFLPKRLLMWVFSVAFIRTKPRPWIRWYLLQLSCSSPDPHLGCSLKSLNEVD